MAATAKREAHLIEIPLSQHVTLKQINQHVTLVRMPDLVTFDFYVQGDHCYIVHFVNPHYFEKEFAAIGEGHNLFTGKENGETECYLFDDTRLRNIVAEVEGHCRKAPRSFTRGQTGTVSPCTGPILIPPRPSGG